MAHNIVFTLRLSAHLPSLSTRAGLGTISSSSTIVRFVQVGVVKTFRYTTSSNVTDQASEQLDNAHPDVDFGPLRLYRVITGDITANSGWGDPSPYSSPPNLPAGGVRNSSIARGYIASFTLDADGRLTLLSYTYPCVPPLGRDIVDTANELLTEDFWLVMKPYFRGPRTYVPFHDGVIVTDQSKWITPT